MQRPNLRGTLAKLLSVAVICLLGIVFVVVHVQVFEMEI